MHIKQLISRYEVMSQKGTVPFIEETVYLDMIDRCDTDGKNRLALRIVEEGITQHPFSAELYLRKAHLLLGRHKITESLVTIEQAEIFAPQHVNVRLLHAELLALRGDNTEALAILDDLKPDVGREDR